MIATTRRQLLALFGATSIAVPLAACGTATVATAPEAEQAETKPESKPAPEPETIELKGITHAQVVADDNDRVNADFVAQNGGRINVTTDISPNQGEMQNNLKIAAAAGSIPYDFLWINAHGIMSFAAGGLLTELDPYIARDGVDMADLFAPYALSIYTLFGKSWGLPKNQATVNMFYNVDALQQAGLDAPQAGWNWEDWLDLSEKLTTRQGDKVERFGTQVGPWGQTQGYNWIVLNGGDILNEDKTAFKFGEEAGLDAIKFVHDLVYKYRVAPTNQEMTDLGNHFTMFTSGAIALYPSGSFLFGRPQMREFNWHAQMLPASVRPASVIHAGALAVLNPIAHPDAAWEFIKHSTTSEVGEQSTAVWNLPATWRGAANWAELSDYPEAAKVFVQAMEIGYAYPYSYFTNEWVAAVRNELNKGWANEVGIEEAVGTAVKAGNLVLEKEQEELARLGIEK